MYASIAIFSPPYKILTYQLPFLFESDFWKIGQRVFVPVGNSIRLGCIVDLPAKEKVTEEIKYREIIFPLEKEPVLTPLLMALANEISKRQGIQPGAVFAGILPAGIKAEDLRVSVYIDNKKLVLNKKNLAALPDNIKARLANALQNNKVKIVAGERSDADLEICAVAGSPPWPIRPAAKKQLEILQFLHEQGNKTRKQLINKFGSSAREPLAKLVAKGLIKLKFADDEQWDFVEPAKTSTNFILNPEQQTALQALHQTLLSKKAETILLYGITGSGKTVIYLELAKLCLQNKKSVLLLAPEVALAHKLMKDAQAMLCDAPVILYHGYQSASVREKTFKELRYGCEAVLVIGTRSALFLPIPNLHCIILDEEHDASYKQDEKLPYHAKELAWYLVEQVAGLLVLGSATPDIRTFQACASGKIPKLELRHRASGSSLPIMELTTINQSAGIGGDPRNSALLSKDTEDALQRCLEKGEQAVVLQNRRGYAPLIFCLTCEHTIKCPNCQIGLAYHKTQQRLICHYCGYDLAWPSVCPECGDSSYIPIGEGTEKIAEYLESISGKPVLRLDRDSVRRSGQIDEILSAFAKGDAPFLVGTQMLSKGHHFPNVTLVVAADGDIGLNLPDYRSAERSFQLLTQAAGRAGRGTKPGKAIIQTRNPEHYCWQHIIKQDYEGFYETELAIRKKYNYPPFIKLGLLRVSYPITEAQGREAVFTLGREIKNYAKKLDIQVLGPAPAPLAMQKGRMRFQFLFKSSIWQPMRELWFFANKQNLPAKLRLFLDLDPVSML